MLVISVITASIIMTIIVIVITTDNHRVALLRAMQVGSIKHLPASWFIKEGIRTEHNPGSLIWPSRL